MVKTYARLFGSISLAGKMLKPFSEIPGPKSLPLVGTLLNYVPPFGKFTMDRLHRSGKLKYEKYGKLVREEILPGTFFLFLFDPVDIETMFRNEGQYPCRRSHTAIDKYRMVDTPEDHNSGGLLPTNGEEWGKIRTSFQKVLSRENVRLNIPKSDEICSQFVNRIHDLAGEEFLPYLLRLNMELIGEHFFGVRLNSFGKDVGPDFLPEKLIEAACLVNSLTMKTDAGLQLWRWIDTPMYRKLTDRMSLLEKTAKFYLSQHMGKPEDESERKRCALETWLKEGKADLKDIMTMSADMILAGIDTTAYTLSFVMYHLGTNWECQEKLFEEMKRLLPERDTPITTEILAEATYLKLAIRESLRLHPVSIGVGRILPEDTDIGGYNVPANVMIPSVMIPYGGQPATVTVTMNQVICRFPEYFEKPDEYIPDRWSIQNRRMAKTHPYLLLPFGHGPRACVGRRVAEQNMHIFIARLCRQFQFEWTGPEPLDCVSSNINRPDAPLFFKFTPRE